MRYVLGIDGGQTATKAVLMAETGHVLGWGLGGPANHIREPGGVERVQRSLSDAIGAARAMAGRQCEPVACAYLGMTGLAADMDAICRPVVPTERIALGHDTATALYSVTLGGPGAVVIAGTGSVACGQDAGGRTASVGGWGYLLGDEGSGHWIALRVLNACTRAADGRARPTALTGFVLEQAGCATLRELHGRLYSGAIARPQIAAFAVCAGQAAAAGDATAQAILRAAGRQLAQQAAVVLRRLRLSESAVPVGTVGGVFRADRWVLDPFRCALARVMPLARCTWPRVPAPVAAGLLALRTLGVTVSGTTIDTAATSSGGMGL